MVDAMKYGLGAGFTFQFGKLLIIDPLEWSTTRRCLWKDTRELATFRLTITFFCLESLDEHLPLKPLTMRIIDATGTAKDLSGRCIRYELGKDELRRLTFICYTTVTK